MYIYIYIYIYLYLKINTKPILTLLFKSLKGDRFSVFYKLN